VAQIRVMADDPEHAGQILGQLLALIDTPGSGLVAGRPTSLRHRGGGGRFVFDLDTRQPSTGPIRVHAERIYEQDEPRPRFTRHTPRALPPG
jgi:hypothetical protein